MYGTLEKAATYFATRLESSVWDTATTDKKTRALETAQRRIDRLNFAGERTSDAQSVEFPRDGDTTVPVDIEIAGYEIAYELLDGRDPEQEIRNLGKTSFGYGQASTQYDRSLVPEHLVHGIPSALAWSYLRPYLRDGQNFTISRVS